METGYVPSLRTDRPSMGTVFRQLGYRTAYFGKFELRRDIISPKKDVNYSDALAAYGFEGFEPDGDKTGAPDQGYDTDIYTAGKAIRWMRTHGHALNRQGIPWLLVVSFISPHDIMYADVNQPGSDVQKSLTGGRITKPPGNTAFAARWKFPPSPSALEPLDKPGRPRAQLSYKTGWAAWLGEIPTDATAMWNDYYNLYLNMVRDNDRTLQGVLDTVSALDLWSSTVVVRTADHGELGDAAAPEFMHGVVNIVDRVAHTSASVSGVIRRLGEPVQFDPELLGQLRTAGVMPGATATIAAAGSYVSVQVDGFGDGLELPNEVAAHIYVER